MKLKMQIKPYKKHSGRQGQGSGGFWSQYPAQKPGKGNRKIISQTVAVNARQK